MVSGLVVKLQLAYLSLDFQIGIPFPLIYQSNSLALALPVQASQKDYLILKEVHQHSQLSLETTD